MTATQLIALARAFERLQKRLDARNKIAAGGHQRQGQNR